MALRFTYTVGRPPQRSQQFLAALHAVFIRLRILALMAVQPWSTGAAAFSMLTPVAKFYKTKMQDHNRGQTWSATFRRSHNLQTAWPIDNNNGNAVCGRSAGNSGTGTLWVYTALGQTPSSCSSHGTVCVDPAKANKIARCRMELRMVIATNAGTDRHQPSATTALLHSSGGKKWRSLAVPMTRELYVNC